MRPLFSWIKTADEILTKAKRQPIRVTAPAASASRMQAAIVLASRPTWGSWRSER
jgi:hypothetical protein